MKYYPFFIFLSVLFSLSHFLFIHYPARIEWAVFDFSQSIAGTSVLTALIMYLTTPFHKIGLKLFLLVYMVLCIVSSVDFLLINYRHPLWVDIAILGNITLYILCRTNKWDLNNIRGDKISPDKIYFVFQKPYNLATWAGSLFGSGVGSMYVAYNRDKYYMSKSLNAFSKRPFKGLAHGEIAFEIVIDNYFGVSRITNETIITELDTLIGIPFSYIRKNCVTVLKEIIEKYHLVEPKTVFPSVYIKQFIR